MELKDFDRGFGFWRVVFATILVSVAHAGAKDADQCVFRNYDNCRVEKGCCRVFINEEFMCLRKEQLLYDYQNKHSENFADGQTIDEGIVYAENAGLKPEEICARWLEINDVFFTGSSVSYTCECATSAKKLTVFFAFSLLFSFLIW